MATIFAPTLSRAEWHAVSIALHDADSYRCSPVRGSWLGRVLTLLTGIEPPHPLADARLEAIRRFVCLARRKPDAVADAMPDLEAQGFSQAQLEALALLSR